MHRSDPRPKLRKSIPIPDELHESLKEALQLIRESERDPDFRVDYDDAIQTPNLCGGRVGTGQRPFEFIYHCPTDPPSRWHLAFHLLEIEDIVSGHTTQINLHCCASPDCGHKSTDPDDLCECDYVEDPHRGNIKFPAAAATLKHLGIDGITAKSTKEDVIAILGEPDLSGGGKEHAAIGYVYPWIKYQRTDCQLRFEFQRAKGIRLVSVLEPDWEPGV